MGPDRSSGPWIVLLVLAHFGVAAALRTAGWPVVLLVGYFGGTLLSHNLGVMIHEATHGLVARRRGANQLWLLVCNLPLVIPAAVSFQHDHLLHHVHLGEVDGRDTQSPVPAERRWVGSSSWRKFASFTFGRFFYPGNPVSKMPFAGWLLANTLAQVVVIAPFAALCGWRSMTYLAVSSLAAFGPHPLGARRVSEHLAAARGQPTNSYYGPWDALTFHVGYHVEHHDFPGIPWSRLPRLRTLARVHYDNLFWIRSWTWLLLEYFLRPSHRVDHYVGLGTSIAEEQAGQVSHRYGSDADFFLLAERQPRDRAA